MSKKKRNKQNKFILNKTIERVEYYRSAIALLPEETDINPGVAYLKVDEKKEREERFCTCGSSKRATCSHVKELMDIHRGMVHVHGKNRFEENFQSSLWYCLFQIMVEKNKITPTSVVYKTEKKNNLEYLKTTTIKDDDLVLYYSKKSDIYRFIERCTQNGNENNDNYRQDVYKNLSNLMLTENERAMAYKGYKTRRMAQEESFWYFFTYHCFREFEYREYTLKTDITDKTCVFILICLDKKGNPIFEIPIPRENVKAVNEKIVKKFSVKQNIPTHPIPMEPVLDVSLEDKAINISVVYRFMDSNKKIEYLKNESLLPFKYGNIFHIKEKNILAEVQPSREIVNKFIKNNKCTILEDDIPEFLLTHGKELKEGPHLVDPELKNIKIINAFDNMVIHPKIINRDWCWLSVDYGWGDSAVSLTEILEARDKNYRFIKTDNGWIDTNSPNLDGFETLSDISSLKKNYKETGKIKLSRLDLLRLSAVGHFEPTVEGNDKKSSQFRNILEMKPLTKIQEYKGMTSTLREYQKTGTDWIRYLYENRFGGLLCDDMGLGKTHQVMAFMLHIKKNKTKDGPFLVICPTTVLSHWENKIKEHVPGLTAVVHHGSNRDFEKNFREHDVIITTYGILRQDINNISKIIFTLTVFDEAQFIKNSETKAYKAAKKIRTNMKLGLSGTPIENSLSELKSLMDIVIPGYLGSDLRFKERYINPIETESNIIRRKELSRIISPFTLRRLKKSVLDELPEKIENIYTCFLSEDQVKLYQEAISSRGIGLLNNLSDKKQPVPYIHIFALLTLLKQICNHPVLIHNKIDDYKKYNSGKWEMFKELIGLCLDNGQKIVVYSQFLGMIEIIENHLKEQNISFVSLTGASTNRGKIINKFNNDPDCRVFVGSLKAGGIGIDLVAASTVIHYDRWWNAAKEDQATDRVHRMGQKSVVQVFKLVTKGTLEEKISAIIEKKRNLMDSVVKEDDPNQLKTFTREQLVDILNMPVH